MVLVTEEQLKLDLHAVIEQALSGESVMITHDDFPILELVPAKPERKPRRPETAKGMFEIFDDSDDPLEDFKD